MSGPRNYRSGTEKALFQLSQGACYFPDCATPVIVSVGGVPIVNVHISHIRGGSAGSPRYDPKMTDQERASFDNLLLLCKPHHDLVDTIDPDAFPIDLLKEWKATREGEGLVALRRLGDLTEDRLVEMIESAVTAIGPQRVVELEIAGGALLPGHGALTVPIEGWREILSSNEDSLRGERAVVTTARNTGHLLAHIDAVEISFQVARGRTVYEVGFLGRNDYPDLNPALPRRLEVGEAANWLTALETFAWVVSRVADTSAALQVVEFRAQARLGSGEKITSATYKIADLPLEPRSQSV